MNTPGIIILAAGLGKRYHLAGGQGNKLMATYIDENGNSIPLLKRTVEEAQNSALPIMLITRPEYESILELADKCKVKTLCISSTGSGDSIAAAVRATPHWMGWLIQPGDMAWVTTKDHQLVGSKICEGKTQVRLMWQRQPGHPVGFSTEYRGALSQLQGDRGARSIIDPNNIYLINAHPGVIRDADLPSADPIFNTNDIG